MTEKEILAIYNRPMMELVYEAATVHRQYHNPNEVQVCTLISIKTGACAEDCAYCPQSARYKTQVEGMPMMNVEEMRQKAIRAKQNGSTRVCMGAAWRNVKDGPQFEQVLEMVRIINKMGMEVCCTLGMLTANQAKRLEEAGLYAYNHNLNTSEDFYKRIITTRSYQDRLDTIANVQQTKISVCSGGIIGMGERLEDRAGMLAVLAQIQPASVPINALVPVKGTLLEEQQPVSIFEMVRMVATTRIVLPRAELRLSAGRVSMSKEGQALCFMAGANSIFSGEKLLTTPNASADEDKELFRELGLQPKMPFAQFAQPQTVEAADSQLESLGENPRWSRPKRNA